MAIETFAALSGTDRLRPANIDIADLYTHVMENGVAVISGCFPAASLTRLRDTAHAWGGQTPMHPPQTYVDDNFHSIEAGISPRQKTPHVYHAYNFYRPLELSGDVKDPLLDVFERLLEFQNTLTGNQASFEPDERGRKARPQIIQYPSGGGMFGRHTHPLEPQRIGLILGLSKRGYDFFSGSTHFEANGVAHGTEDLHDQGDLLLFRFDIPHWITAVDQGSKFDPSSVSGRWTAVLPYY
ncbi:hypothetical protein MKK84_01880 [Methylobacterium sp. E-065]|uniref:hypothetical protein n=1 Tax=Methylobacterium sp. E-065 TaxID=2836583 RepID=UPI001FB95336|nr:hypothetical protein [Methylobacterium sp. E-065]MCJ2016188.1 hypothetical protein [Methylobacterium sp. E-065]